MSRAYRSKAQWQALIDEFEQSGLSRKAFCEARGINPDYFSQRRRQLQQETESTGFAGWRLSRRRHPTAAMQVRVGDAQLVLPMSVSPRWVAELVKALSV